MERGLESLFNKNPTYYHNNKTEKLFNIADTLRAIWFINIFSSNNTILPFNYFFSYFYKILLSKPKAVITEKKIKYMPVNSSPVLKMGFHNIPALREGNEKAFKDIYSEFYGVLYHLCIHYIHDEKIAEEIVQDTYLKLWEVRETLNEQINIRNFLYTITKNNCLNHLRNQKVSMKHMENMKYLEMHFNYEALEKSGDYFQFEELRTQIEVVILRLPPEIIQTFKLSRFEELSYKEISDQQNISIKTVEARISKALRILRVELKDFLPVIYLITKIP